MTCLLSEVPLERISTELREVHSAKADSSIDVRLAGRVMEVREAQFRNAPKPIDWSPSWRETEERAVHLAKAYSSIDWRPSGRVMEVREVQ